MGKITVATIGTIKIKMDTKDSVYFDAKDPHVSFEENDSIIVDHIPLSEVDNLVGTGNSNLKKAIHYLRDNKDDIIRQYLAKNR